MDGIPCVDNFKWECVSVHACERRFIDLSTPWMGLMESAHMCQMWRAMFSMYLHFVEIHNNITYGK